MCIYTKLKRHCKRLLKSDGKSHHQLRLWNTFSDVNNSRTEDISLYLMQHSEHGYCTYLVYYCYNMNIFCVSILMNYGLIGMCIVRDISYYSSYLPKCCPLLIVQICWKTKRHKMIIKSEYKIKAVLVVNALGHWSGIPKIVSSVIG